MALINVILKARTPGDMALALRNANVIGNRAAMEKFRSLLSPLTEEKKHIIQDLVVEMSEDHGSPNQVSAALTDLEKQAMVDDAIRRLESIREEAEMQELQQAGPRPQRAAAVNDASRPHSSMGKIVQALGGSYAGFGLADVVGDFLPAVVSAMRGGNSTPAAVAREAAAGATETIAHEATEAGSGAARFFSIALLSVLLAAFFGVIIAASYGHLFLGVVVVAAIVVFVPVQLMHMVSKTGRASKGKVAGIRNNLLRQKRKEILDVMKNSGMNFPLSPKQSALVIKQVRDEGLIDSDVNNLLADLARHRPTIDPDDPATWPENVARS